MKLVAPRWLWMLAVLVWPLATCVGANELYQGQFQAWTARTGIDPSLCS